MAVQPTGYPDLSCATSSCRGMRLAVRRHMQAKVMATWCCIAGSGLIAFALTVALVQQSVRGAIETNVKTGGTLFEIDHVSP